MPKQVQWVAAKHLFSEYRFLLLADEDISFRCLWCFRAACGAAHPRGPASLLRDRGFSILDYRSLLRCALGTEPAVSQPVVAPPTQSFPFVHALFWARARSGVVATRAPFVEEQVVLARADFFRCVPAEPTAGC